MKESIVEALSCFESDEAATINQKHSDAYILHYYKRAKAHEKSGKIKGEFGDYYRKLLTKDKAKFYEKGARNEELAQKKLDKERKARAKTNRMLESLKDKEKMATEGVQRSKEMFRALPELEQNRRIKREATKTPSNSFHQNRDAAVLTFHAGK